MKHDSPLRYPGGKASLAAFLRRTIELNDLTGCPYFEPFAGGAGAALRLLREGTVSNIYLNDLDPRITAFWHAVLNEPARFADTILSVPVSIAEWKKQWQVYLRKDAKDPFALGFATFYLNRCNRSGVLSGAAPIGGYAQAGKWKIDARFGREGLAERVTKVAQKREQIHITNTDAREFLAKRLPRGHGRKRAFVYLDPPYYSKGGRLYLNSYSHKEHDDLARHLRRQNTLKWVMSYDNARFIRGLYETFVIHSLPIRYSLQRKQQMRELLISPSHVQIPMPPENEDVRARDDINPERMFR
ncbi:MAG: DNA adenine methylase [Gammaproteobacteria bacterium]|nr:DNA adenine methylase [Gammaproteobacteria bacterium]